VGWLLGYPASTPGSERKALDDGKGKYEDTPTQSDSAGIETRIPSESSPELDAVDLTPGGTSMVPTGGPESADGELPLGLEATSSVDLGSKALVGFRQAALTVELGQVSASAFFGASNDDEASAQAAASEVTRAACELIGDHAWSLLEAGQLAALAQLSTATNALPAGLSGIMAKAQPGVLTLPSLSIFAFTSIPPAAPSVDPCPPITPSSLLSCLGVCAQQLPVWNGEVYEEDAVAVRDLVATLGERGTAWALALSVITVHSPGILHFRHEYESVWIQFVADVKIDPTYSFLHHCVEMLSDSAEGASLSNGLSASAATATDYSMTLMSQSLNASASTLLSFPSESSVEADVEGRLAQGVKPGYMTATSEIQVASPRN
jgi:hypothetical protein